VAGADESRAWLYRVVLRRQGQIEACLLVDNETDRAGLAARFADATWNRISAPYCPPGSRPYPTPGPLCACLGIGFNRLCAAIVKEGLRTADAVDRTLKAGTSCCFWPR
jgi:NAD(P)H-nitrite reductase large subunit